MPDGDGYSTRLAVNHRGQWELRFDVTARRAALHDHVAHRRRAGRIRLVTLLLGVLVASLVGSIHCAAMCGGFVCLYAGSGARVNAAWMSARTPRTTRVVSCRT